MSSRKEIGKGRVVVAIMIVVLSAYRRCTIRVWIFVLRTQILLANTAGTTPIRCRTRIGKERVVMAIMIVVQSVNGYTNCGPPCTSTVDDDCQHVYLGMC